MQPIVSQEELTNALREEQHIVDLLNQARFQPDWASARTSSRVDNCAKELEVIIRLNLPDQ